MEWSEPLPPDCPPKEAFIPDEFKVYRLVKKPTPVEKDFYSQQARQPNKKFEGVNDCIVRAVSVFSDVAVCSNMLKLPIHRKRWKAVAEITLTPADGKCQQTGKNKAHYSWWRTEAFKIERCEIIENV